MREIPRSCVARNDGHDPSLVPQHPQVHSSPAIGGVAQLVRANGSYPLGHQFKSGLRYHLSPKNPLGNLLSCAKLAADLKLSLDFASISPYSLAASLALLSAAQ